MSPSETWTAVHRRGPAGEFHALEVPEGVRRELWWFEVDRPALVLGSTQPEETVDRSACEAAGVDVVRRRSGGGSVLMLPGEMVWLDVVVGRDDPLWDDDIGRATWWLGEVWRTALAGLGAPEPVVHQGAMVANAWSKTVCFAGLGPGEVTVGRAKLLGLSQRRTRSWARLQCGVHLRWRPDVVASLLAPLPSPLSSPLSSRPSSDDLAPLVAAIDAPVSAIEAAVEAALPVTG